MAERRRVRSTSSIVEPKIEENMGKPIVLDETFFGADGITLTSAERTANRACERVNNLVAELGGIRLYNSEFKLAGDNPTEQLSFGWDEDKLYAID